MTQEERLNYLVEAFKADSGEYKDLQTPADPEGKRRILRSLMNIRMPRQLAEDTLEIQDTYLKERIEENGTVTPEEIPTVMQERAKQFPCGQFPIWTGKVSIWQGDITRLSVDAIVNAANSQMLGCFVPMHTCIDNCIHTFAGVQLRAECHRQMQALRLKYGRDYEQPTSVPMLTPGYNLPAKHVIHVVGPIVPEGVRFDGQDPYAEKLEADLAACYRNTLDLCTKNSLRTVAFCCISTGVFHFPNDRAAEIAVQTVSAWLCEHPDAIDRVIFNVFKDEDLQIYTNLLINS